MQTLLSGTEELYECDYQEARNWRPVAPMGCHFYGGCIINTGDKGSTREKNVIADLSVLEGNPDRSNLFSFAVRTMKIDQLARISTIGYVYEWAKKDRPVYVVQDTRMVLVPPKGPDEITESCVL